MGKNRRQDRLRQRRDGGGSSAKSAPAAPAPRQAKQAELPGWRHTLNQWGGLPVVGSLTVAVVVVVALVWVNRPGASAGDDAFAPVARQVVSGRTEGKADAPVKIIEYADFQCPFCGRFTRETAPKLVEEFVNTGQAQIEFRHYAFIGEESKKAAEAAECAADQGHFWPMHDIIFLRQGAENAGVYSSSNLKKYAREVADKVNGFDAKQFDTCLDSGEKRATVEQMAQEAVSLGVRSTPTFFVNGQMVSGAQPIDEFRKTIEAAKTRGK